MKRTDRRFTQPVCAGLAACTLTFLALSGCGGSSSVQGGSAPSLPASPLTPAVSLTASPSGSITLSQSLSISIQVTATSGSAPAGSVVLSSGSYASFPATLDSLGHTTVTIPAGLLPPGSDTLVGAFAPANAAAYTAATGTATVSVSASVNTPTVTSTSVSYPTLGRPFRALVAPSGNVLVSVTGSPSGVQIFKPVGGGGLQAFCLNYLRPAFQADGDPVLGIAFFGSNAGLAEAIGNDGAIFQSAALIQDCTSTGTPISQGTLASTQGTFDLTVTADGKYAFLANEYGVASGAATQGNIGVVALQYDGSGNFSTSSTLLGQISTGGNAIAGILLSPDGTRLYVTTEIAAPSTTASGGSNPVLAKTACVQQAGSSARNGLLTVIDVAKAEANPSTAAILATVDAGCSPVRMVETDDLSTIWVSARGDNRVLAFSPGMLEWKPDNALLGYADTGGTAPVGMGLFHGQKLLGVANSNRFGVGAGTTNATILSVAVPSAASVLQTIQTGLFPREIVVGPDDATLYLTNYDSNTLQVISTTVR